ncbi:glycosyltransferase [Oceanobacillus iheyensis]|uniref:glycosyltransferase n=1 Tax=Oceanobacillus iheyensis TaxID=182710 RepID=UPI00363ED95C
MSIILNVSVALIIISIVSGWCMFFRNKKLYLNREVDHLKMLSVIIPARNEGGQIGRLLDSINIQTYKKLEVLVVDDGSTDNTAEIVRSFGYRVIKNELNKGWVGKSSACWKGANQANGEYLLFLDADTELYKPDSLETIVNHFGEKGSSGILSIEPYHIVKKWYESFSVVFNIIVVTGMNVFTPIKSKLKPAGAFGPTIICSKEDYFNSGGHFKYRDSVMDNFGLAKAIEEKGLPIHCYLGKQTIHFRMYPNGIKQLVEGWTKSFATASESTHPLVMTLISMWISGAFVTSLLLIISPMLSNSNWIIISFILYSIYAVQCYVLARRVGNFPFFPHFLFYPVLFLFFTIVFIRSLYLTKVKKSVKWKGRDIDV